MIGRYHSTGDVQISQVGSLLTGAEYARQKIFQVLRMFKGEWEWSPKDGIAYYRDILVKGPNIALIQDIYKTKILTVPGIVAVNRLELSVDPASRLLSVSFSATYRDETGETEVEGQT